MRGGENSTYSSAHDGVALCNSDVLNGTNLYNAIRHSAVKKADGSSADKKHSSTKEHKSNRASSSVTPAPADNSVQHQTSRARSDSDDEVSTSCFCIKRKRKKVAPKQKQSSDPTRDKVYKKKYKVAAAVVAALVVAPAAAAVAALAAPALVAAASIEATAVITTGACASTLISSELGAAGAVILASSKGGLPVLAGAVAPFVTVPLALREATTAAPKHKPDTVFFKASIKGVMASAGVGIGMGVGLTLLAMTL